MRMKEESFLSHPVGTQRKNRKGMTSLSVIRDEK